jgi:hypothetical protein
MEWREEVDAYVGPHAGKYREIFSRFRGDGTGGFGFSWNWPAFFAGVLWYLYRKMYLWAAIDFAVSVALGWTFFVPLFWAVIRALTGNYLYFLQAERKIEEAPAATPERLEWLRREGGVHRWVAWAAILGVLLLVGTSVLFFRFLWEMLPELRNFWESHQGFRT